MSSSVRFQVPSSSPTTYTGNAPSSSDGGPQDPPASQLEPWSKPPHSPVPTLEVDCCSRVEGPWGPPHLPQQRDAHQRRHWGQGWIISTEDGRASGTPPKSLLPPPAGRQRHRALVIKTLRSAPVSTSLPYSYFNLKLSYIYYIQAKSCRPESSILYQPYECIYSLEPQDLPTNVHITHKQNYNQHTHRHIAIMPGQTDSYTISIPVSPPPPQSISTYSRFMHDHTKRQMESFGAIAPAGGSRGSTSSSSVSSSLTNGVGHSEYH
ncbi:hypothetical protein PCL_05109 [Purpureocillium lilacinum]|uniref:Uncharacterized protein n=3 Tax=Purpureocillium lilacinum TaxID=33203 RepID=A0A2U3DVX7_PURLI|nr:hypothetical protein PCL_05109 [Purpureocillium lilacinum]